MKYVGKSATGGEVYKAFADATDDQIRQAEQELSRLGAGRVTTVNGHKVKKDKLGYYSVDGGTPTTQMGALKQIFA